MATGIAFFAGTRSKEMVQRIHTTIDPRKLKRHPLNAKVFNTKPDREFIESVKEDGVIEPIITNHDDVIISGEKRANAAIKAGLKEVPIIQDRQFDDAMLAEKAVILCNVKRHELTNEEKGRAYMELKKVLQKLKRRAQKMHGKPSDNDDRTPQSDVGRRPTFTSEEGRSGDVAAAEFGMDRKNAEKRAKVVQKIDEAEEDGDADRAEELRTTLNRSVDAAHSMVTNSKQEKETWKQHAGGIVKTMDTLYDRIVALLDKDKLGHNQMAAESAVHLGTARARMKQVVKGKK